MVPAGSGVGGASPPSTWFCCGEVTGAGTFVLSRGIRTAAGIFVSWIHVPAGLTVRTRRSSCRRSAPIPAASVLFSRAVHAAGAVVWDDSTYLGFHPCESLSRTPVRGVEPVGEAHIPKKRRHPWCDDPLLKFSLCQVGSPSKCIDILRLIVLHHVCGEFISSLLFSMMFVLFLVSSCSSPHAWRIRFCVGFTSLWRVGSFPPGRRTLDRLFNPVGPFPSTYGEPGAAVDTDLPDQPRPAAPDHSVIPAALLASLTTRQQTVRR
jgi:hypothetical protein